MGMSETGSTILLEVAERSQAIAFADCPKLAIETAKEALLDLIGVTLGGAKTDSVSSVTNALERGFADGPALLFGGRRRVDILSAAMVNGTAAHALDFDDCSNTLGGHPSAPVVPALWALAEERGASGMDFLVAFIAGIEVETRIARAVNFHHYEKGWHPTATLGIFGSAAACSHLMGLSADVAARALSIAASSAAGLKANFGTMTKPFHVGQCARNGLQAALLAEAGLSANDAAMEHPQGFLSVYNGEGNYDAARILQDWAAPLDIIEPGIAFKRHPCCASTHPAIDVMLMLREKHNLNPDNVASILSWTHPRRLRHTNRPDPQNGLDGKFSVQYVLARALYQGMVRTTDFTDQAIFDAPIRAIMDRITAEPHPDAVYESTEHFFAEVTVTMRDGRVLTGRVERPVGRDRDHPLPTGALEAKFADCAGAVLSSQVCDQIAGRILEFEKEADISQISALLSVDGQAVPTAKSRKA